MNLLRRYYKNENDLNGGVAVYWNHKKYLTGNRYKNQVELYDDKHQFIRTVLIKAVYSILETIKKPPGTIFLDIDGVLLEHKGDAVKQITDKNPVLLPKTLEKLVEWDRNGYNIILVSGRRESCRAVTEKQLAEKGIFYDQLVMGIGPGPRYLVNDRKKDSAENTAFAINLNRNEGIGNVQI